MIFTRFGRRKRGTLRKRHPDPGTEGGEGRTKEKPRVFGGGGARGERLPLIHPPAPSERRQTSEIAKKGRTHPCGTGLAK